MFMPPISTNLLLFKGTIDVSVIKDMLLLLLVELNGTDTDRVAKLLPE